MDRQFEGGVLMPKYEVTVNNPAAGDVELDVAGISGLVKNGDSVTVDLDTETAKSIQGEFVTVKKVGTSEKTGGGDK